MADLFTPSEYALRPILPLPNWQRWSDQNNQRYNVKASPVPLQGPTIQQTYIFPPNQPEQRRYTELQRARFIVDAPKYFDGTTHTFVVTGTPTSGLWGNPSFTGGAAASSMRLYINGVDRTTLLQNGTTQINLQMAQRTTAQFTMYDPLATSAPTQGQRVVIIDHNVTVFAGIIDSVTLQQIVDANNNSNFFYMVQALDFGALCDRRIVNTTYPSGSILQNVYYDLINSFMTGDGLTHINVDGFQILAADITFDGLTVAQCLDDLRNTYGEDWWIDYNADLHTHVFTSWPNAPFSITESSTNFRKFTAMVQGISGGYRNVQYIRAQVNVTVGTRSETFTADGTSPPLYPTNFALTAAPQVTVNGVQQAIHQLGVDPFGMIGVYWIQGGAGFQFFPQTPITAGAVIVITYGSYFSNLLVVQNSAQIAAQAAIDGTSGRVENVYQTTSVSGQDVLPADGATAIAQGLLARSGTPPVTISLETDSPGLAIGQLLQVTRPLFGLNGKFIITQLQMSSADSADQDLTFGTAFRTVVTASSNLDQGAAMNWFMRLYARTNKGQIPPAPEVHVWDLGVGGDLVLGSDWTDILVAPINFQNSGLMINTSISARQPPVGQKLIIRVLQQTAAMVAAGTNPATIFGTADAANLVLLDKDAMVESQSAFVPNPCQVTGSVGHVADRFTVQGKYVATSGPVTNCQDVLVQLFMQF